MGLLGVAVGCRGLSRMPHPGVSGVGSGTLLDSPWLVPECFRGLCDLLPLLVLVFPAMVGFWLVLGCFLARPFCLLLEFGNSLARMSCDDGALCWCWKLLGCLVFGDPVVGWCWLVPCVGNS